MTRKIAAGCFAAMFGLAVSAGAQTPSEPSTPQTPPSTPSTPSPSTPSSPTNPYPSAQTPSADRAGKEVKLTGCIQAGTSASSFELTNIKKGMSDHSTPASGAAADKASKNVKLTAASGVDLAAHVGHTVEVTGSWAKSGDTPSAAAPSASAAGSTMAKELTVKDVKMVSSTCSAGTN